MCGAEDGQTSLQHGGLLAVQSTALTSGVEHRLRNKVLKSAAPRLEASQRPWRGGTEPAAGEIRGHQGAAQASDSDSEGEGRGGAFGKATKRPQAPSRAELLTTGKAAAKKRKRGGKPAGTGGGGNGGGMPVLEPV
jgi:hypothetical protein